MTRGGPSFNTKGSVGAVVWEGKISTCLEELRSQTTPMSFCKRISLFVPLWVASGSVDVQDTWSFSRFSIKYYLTSPQHKGDPEENQTTLPSISEWRFSTHISCGIKIALNPGLSKLLKAENLLQVGNGATTETPQKGLSFSEYWDLLVSFCVSKRELTNIEVPTAKSRVSMNRELFGKRVWVSTSPFHVSLSRSD